MLPWNSSNLILNIYQTAHLHLQIKILFITSSVYENNPPLLSWVFFIQVREMKEAEGDARDIQKEEGKGHLALYK